MAEAIEVDPFATHEIKVETTDETFPLTSTLVNHTTDHMGVDETSFITSELSLRHKVFNQMIHSLYEKLSHGSFERETEVIHADLFEIRDNELYYADPNDPNGKNPREPLTKDGILKPVLRLEKILGARRLNKIGFDTEKKIKIDELKRLKENQGKELTDDRVIELRKLRERISLRSELKEADDIELEEIATKTINAVESVGTGTDDLFKYPLRELLGLDREVKNIRGALKVDVAKKVQLEEHIEKEKGKLNEMANDDEYTDEQRKRVRDRLAGLNDQLRARQESIDALRGRLKNQITSIKETISKVLDENTSLGEKIRTLFREQGITIVSVLTAFGMVIGFIVELLVPGSGGGGGGSSNPSGKKGGAKEWVKNKLKAIASLLGKLASKAAAALPGIIGSIVSWILNRAKEAVGWLAQNLWALIIGVGGLIYTYMVTRNQSRQR